MVTKKATMDMTLKVGSQKYTLRLIPEGKEYSATVMELPIGDAFVGKFTNKKLADKAARELIKKYEAAKKPATAPVQETLAQEVAKKEDEKAVAALPEPPKEEKVSPPPPPVPEPVVVKEEKAPVEAKSTSGEVAPTTVADVTKKEEKPKKGMLTRLKEAVTGKGRKVTKVEITDKEPEVKTKKEETTALACDTKPFKVEVRMVENVAGGPVKTGSGRKKYYMGTLCSWPKVGSKVRLLRLDTKKHPDFATSKVTFVQYIDEKTQRFTTEHKHVYEIRRVA